MFISAAQRRTNQKTVKDLRKLVKIFKPSARCNCTEEMHNEPGRTISINRKQTPYAHPWISGYLGMKHIVAFREPRNAILGGGVRLTSIRTAYQIRMPIYLQLHEVTGQTWALSYLLTPRALAVLNSSDIFRYVLQVAFPNDTIDDLYACLLESRKFTK